mgnify:CR=1 FL=1
MEARGEPALGGDNETPLIIGVMDGLSKGFTEAQIRFINGEFFGVFMMIVGLGEVKKPAEFLWRVRMTAEALENDLPDWFDLAFVEQMKEGDWSANISNKTTAAWRNHLKTVLWNDLERRVE